MKILFIGGTGNISTDCASLLHQRGHEIIVLSRGRKPLPADYHAFNVDRKDPAAMKSALQRTQLDVVINFLGYELTDVQEDVALFAGHVGKYIFISSATVYAKPLACLPITAMRS